MAQRFRTTGMPRKKPGYWGHIVTVLLILAVLFAAVALYVEVTADIPARTADAPPSPSGTAAPPSSPPPSPQRSVTLPSARDLHTPVFSRESCASLQKLLAGATPAVFRDLNTFLVGSGIGRDLVWRALQAAAACRAFNTRDYSGCTSLDNAFPERRGGRMNCGSMARSISAVAVSLKEHLPVDDAIRRTERYSGAFSPAERSIVEAFSAGDPGACDRVLGYRFGRQLPLNCKAVVAENVSLCRGQEPLDELRCTRITRALLDMKNGTAPAAATGNLFGDIAFLLAGNPVDCMSYARNHAAALCETYATEKADKPSRSAFPPAE